MQAPSATAPDSVPKAVIEQYKVYVADLGTVGSAFATTQSFFLAVVAALIGVLGFKERVRSVPDYFGPVPILIFIFIALVSVVWGLTAWLFENLIGAKFAVLRLMEDKYTGLYPMFQKQTEFYKAHLVYGIISAEYVLIGLIAVGAAVVAVLGICWQIRNRNAYD